MEIADTACSLLEDDEVLEGVLRSVCFLDKEEDDLSEVSEHESRVRTLEETAESELKDLLDEREELILVLVEGVEGIDIFDAGVEFVHEIVIEDLGEVGVLEDESLRWRLLLRVLIRVEEGLDDEISHACLRTVSVLEEILEDEFDVRLEDVLE